MQQKPDKIAIIIDNIGPPVFHEDVDYFLDNADYSYRRSFYWNDVLYVQFQFEYTFKDWKW